MAKTIGPLPLIVGSAEWADTLPEWLLNEVHGERMMTAFLSFLGKGEECEQVGDAEVVCYLMTLSQKVPLTHEATQLYMYCFTKLRDRVGKEVPPDLRVDELDTYHEEELRELRRKTFEKRGGKVILPVLEVLRETWNKPPETKELL